MGKLRVAMLKQRNPRGGAHRPPGFSTKKFSCDATRRPQHQIAVKSRFCANMVASGYTGATRPTKVKKRENVQKRKRDDVDVEKLEQAVQALVRLQRHRSLTERNRLTISLGPQAWLLQRLHRPTTLGPD